MYELVEKNKCTTHPSARIRYDSIIKDENTGEEESAVIEEIFRFYKICAEFIIGFKDAPVDEMAKIVKSHLVQGK